MEIMLLEVIFMFRGMRIIPTVVLSVGIIMLGAAASYVYLGVGADSAAETENAEIGIDGTEADYAKENKTELISAEGGLSSSADFSYEIYNIMTKTTDTVYGNCPTELVGKTMADVKDYYPDWQVTEFSSDKVVLRKEVGGGRDDRYVVGVYNDCVAVFYENSEEGIYMMTDIPVSSLESDKKDMLEEGIYVEGKERLNRILEDYSS